MATHFFSSLLRLLLGVCLTYVGGVRREEEEGGGKG